MADEKEAIPFGHFLCDGCSEIRPDTEANHVGFNGTWCDGCIERFDDGETEYDDRPSASDAYDRASDLKRSLR